VKILTADHPTRGTASLLRILWARCVPMAVALAAIPAAHAEGTSRTEDAASPRLIRVGPHRAVTRIAVAARMAKSGDVIEVDAGEYVDDSASWPQSNLTIRATGGRARMIQHGPGAEGKAIWVFKGDQVTVENFEFSGAHGRDMNAAGIRHEGGRLTVRNCLFEDNQMGLLTWNNERAELNVENSEFRANAVAANHRPGDAIGHQIYVGSIARFTLRESFVHHGAFGHLVKSRARENHIVNNLIADGVGGRASYELEFPSGGIAYVLGNVIAQSAQTENSQLISFGAEGYRWPRNEFYLVNNTLVDDLRRDGVLLRVAHGAGRVVLVNNLMLGNASLATDIAWESRNNRIAGPGDFASAPNGDYRLRAGSALVGKGVEPDAANGVSMRLEREYDHPLRGRPLPAGPLSPGALQSVAP